MNSATRWSRPKSFATESNWEMKTQMPKWLLLPAIAVMAMAQTVPDNVTLEKQVAYNAGSRLAMDLARPKGAGPYPAVIAIHGGGFNSGDRASFDGLISRLAQHGFV